MEPVVLVEFSREVEKTLWLWLLITVGGGIGTSTTSDGMLMKVVSDLRMGLIRVAGRVEEVAFGSNGRFSSSVVVSSVVARESRAELFTRGKDGREI